MLTRLDKIIENIMSSQNIKENAGHENMQTTEIYLHVLDNQRHDEMEKLQWQLNFKDK